MSRKPLAARIQVTYDIVTESSAQDGDMADNGWIEPDSEKQISIGDRCPRRYYSSRVARAQAGKFDWTLRDAITFMRDNSCGREELDVGEPHVHAPSGQPPFANTPANRIRLVSELQVRSTGDGYDIVCGCNGYAHGDNVSYALHVSGVSVGTAARIARLFPDAYRTN